MREIQTIVVSSSNYPTATDPVCPFVEQIVNAFSVKGIEVIVVAPQSIVKHLFRGAELHPIKRVYTYNGGLPITVYQPLVLSFGSRFDRINTKLRDCTIYKILKKNNILPDIFYGHFWHHAFSLYKYAKEKSKPLFVVSGESEISLQRIRTKDELKPFCEYIKGIICVSTKNKDESIEKGLLFDESKSIVIPNAIDNSLFKLIDKQKLRESHKINDNDFVVAFVGWYDNNKGVMRLSNAIKNLNNPDIKVFFIGDNRDNGNMMPDCDGILHTGRLPHEQIPEYLNMADVFVLPTLHEGCNNAIIEAMACGLPIISSDLPFNWDVMNETNSIKVDPMNVDEIANAINELYVDKDLRKKLSEGALETAASLTIDKRADRILKFIQSKI